MKVAVVGLWHLGSVTAGCLASLGFDVTAIDEEQDLIENFRRGKLPVDEPGLADMISKDVAAGSIAFSTDVKDVSTAEVVWITYDTPVDDNDNADTGFVVSKIESLFPYLREGAVVLVSSQLPVGSTRQLQQSFNSQYASKHVWFACSPENLRLGNAINVFMNPDRIVAGVDSAEGKAVLERLFSKITSKVVWMSVPSAEMTKHAINAFLANSIVFINEISQICERVGADAGEVEKGLKSEERIGPKAYLKAGNAFAGGTLARDVTYLIQQREKFGLNTSFFNAIFDANTQHRKWMRLAISQMFPSLKGVRIAVLGLTYKPGTNTLRRSQAVEFCKWASAEGVRILAHDPSLKESQKELEGICTLVQTPGEALTGAQAIVIATSWPEFLSINFDDYVTTPVAVIDSNGFLESKFSKSEKYRYIKIGKRNEVKK